MKWDDICGGRLESIQYSKSSWISFYPSCRCDIRSPCSFHHFSNYYFIDGISLQPLNHMMQCEQGIPVHRINLEGRPRSLPNPCRLRLRHVFLKGHKYSMLLGGLTLILPPNLGHVPVDQDAVVGLATEIVRRGTGIGTSDRRFEPSSTKFPHMEPCQPVLIR